MHDIYWGDTCEGKRGVGPEKACGEPLGGERRGGKKEYWLRSILDCSVILRKFCPVLMPKLPVRGMGQYC